MLTRLTLFCLVGFIVLLERPVMAYLDPGSGSMLLQVLLGGVAAIGIMGRLLWRRATARLGSLFGKRAPAGRDGAGEPR